MNQAPIYTCPIDDKFIPEINKLRDGGMTYTDIAIKMNNSGIKCLNGKRITNSDISRAMLCHGFRLHKYVKKTRKAKTSDLPDLVEHPAPQAVKSTFLSTIESVVSCNLSPETKELVLRLIL